MTKWYVKELSKLTHISVQTLHHYDRINLLIPSLRLENGYRVYSETDLLKLQQIIALKFFGFELAQIKKLLSAELNMQEHFAAQSKLLEQKAEALLAASSKLKQITAATESNKSIPWEQIIETIEVFRMTQQLEETWIGKALSPGEIEQYVQFAKGLETRFSPQEKEKSEAQWFEILKEIKASLASDPASKSSQQLAERIMQWVKQLYGNEFASLRISVWEKGFKNGDAAADHGLSKEAVKWVDQAVQALYRHKALSILNEAGSVSDEELAMRWNDLMEERYHNVDELKRKYVKHVLSEMEINSVARKFLANLISHK